MHYPVIAISAKDYDPNFLDTIFKDIFKKLNIYIAPTVEMHLPHERGVFYLNSKGDFNYSLVLNGVRIVSVLEFLNILSNFYTDLILWRNNLQIGSTVIIEDFISSNDYYPVYFNSTMKSFAGNTATIKDIRQLPGGYDKKYCLGDHRLFSLEEYPFSWHSSMFIMEIIPVKKLILSEVDIL